MTKQMTDDNFNPIPVLSIGVALDIADSSFACSIGVLRITAITDSRVWYRKTNEVKQGSGLLLLAGASIDTSVYNDFSIEVAGSINACKLY